jgi:hypothetical protein
MITDLISALEDSATAWVYNLPTLSRDDTMPHVAANYQKVLKQAQRLPLRARRQLAETLLRPANADEQTILVSMRRFRREAQTRFQDLMDRNNEGQLTPKEREELKALVRATRPSCSSTPRLCSRPTARSCLPPPGD